MLLWVSAVSGLMGLCFLLNNGFQLALGFEFMFRSQISLCSIELGLLLWILMGVRHLVIGSLSIGPSLLPVFLLPTCVDDDDARC